MDTQAIRITIELPQSADVQRASMPSSGGAIDAGSPPPALLMILGDPDVSITQAAVTDDRTIASADAVNAGAFPAHLAMEMETTGPRHPLGHPEMGMLAPGTSPILSPEARN